MSFSGEFLASSTLALAVSAALAAAHAAPFAAPATVPAAPAAAPATAPLPIFTRNSSHFLLESPEARLKTHAKNAQTISIAFVIFPLQLSATFESSAPACATFPVLIA